MTDSDQRLIGELTGTIKTFMANEEAFHKQQLDRDTELFRKIDDIRTNGIALCKQHDEVLKDIRARHEKDIKELKERPVQTISALAAIISAVCAGVSAWWSSMR